MCALASRYPQSRRPRCLSVDFPTLHKRHLFFATAVFRLCSLKYSSSVFQHFYPSKRADGRSFIWIGVDEKIIKADRPPRNEASATATGTIIEKLSRSRYIFPLPSRVYSLK